MKTLIAALLAVLSLARSGFAAEPQACDIPGYLLQASNELKRVESSVNNLRLRIAVVGTGSSSLAGPDGRPSA
jgi:hypothetical protein